MVAKHQLIQYEVAKSTTSFVYIKFMPWAQDARQKQIVKKVMCTHIAIQTVFIVQEFTRNITQSAVLPLY